MNDVFKELGDIFGTSPKKNQDWSIIEDSFEKTSPYGYTIDIAVDCQRAVKVWGFTEEECRTRAELICQIPEMLEKIIKLQS